MEWLNRYDVLMALALYLIAFALAFGRRNTDKIMSLCFLALSMFAILHAAINDAFPVSMADSATLVVFVLVGFCAYLLRRNK